MIALAPATHPALNTAPPRAAAEERTFRTHDGVDLFYRHWPEAAAHRKGAVVLIHRGHEHSGRMAHLVRELALPGFAFFAFDARGHGRSPGTRGDSPGIAHSVRDIQSFIDHIGREHEIAIDEIAVVAQSVGAVLAAAWVHDYAPAIRALVLASPAFKVKLYIPFARKGLALMCRLRGNFFVNSYVKGRFLTHDRERIAGFEADPLITRAISVNMLLGLYETAERIVADAQAVTVPTQLLISGADHVVHERPQHDFFDRLGAAVKERHVFDGFFHDTLGERDRAEAVDLMREFLLRRFRRSPQLSNLLHADRAGFSKDEADALAKPLPRFSPRRLTWALRRAGLAIAGRLSRGVALGQEAGFDSGSMLDYVYNDVPQGRGILGRAIDRAYLNSIGWRGIRRRKQHLAELIAAAADGLRAAGKTAPHSRHRRRSRPHGPRRHRTKRIDAGFRAVAGHQRTQYRGGCAVDRRTTPRRHCPVQARRRLRPRQPRRALAEAHARGGLRPLRTLLRQRTDPSFAGWACGGNGARHLPRLHQPALASATRLHRPGPHQPSRRPALGDASSQPGGDGSAGDRGRLSQDRAAHRSLGHLHRQPRGQGRPLSLAASGAASIQAPARSAPDPGRALLWLAVCGGLFYLGYGFANWAAAQQGPVAAIRFGWEQGIPFLPWTIIPYWSIDLAYALAFFLCLDATELQRHVRRILTAQLVAVLCFLVFPLQLAVAKPATDGITGFLFAALGTFDRPYNQAPSLHIALLVILWALYVRHLPQRFHLALHAWSVLIGASVLTTYQHHFIDVPTGAGLGLLCLWLWPDSGALKFRPTRYGRRRRIGALYALGAAVLTLAALQFGGWSLWLLWPALSLAVVALNYLAFGADGFQKRADGSMPLATRMLVSPYLLGARLNAWLWTGSDRLSEIGDNVWLGGLPPSIDGGCADVCRHHRSLRRAPGIAASWPAPDLSGARSHPAFHRGLAARCRGD